MGAGRGAPDQGLIGATTIAWPSDHRVSVVRPTMTTANGSCRRRRAAVDSPGGEAAHTPTEVFRVDLDDAGHLRSPDGMAGSAASSLEQSCRRDSARLCRAGMKRLSYTSAEQMLGKRFHMS